MNGSSRGKGKHRGRSKKKTCENNAKTDDSLPNSNDEKSTEQESITLDLDADITQLEAPTFSTINKGPPEPMLRLNWDHKTHLIGEKVINPMIHCCDKCEAPILIYGRMIPCKHVFCFCCAERQNKTCPRCQEKIVRIEKTGLGSVFMCTFGGTRYGSNGCRRTYLSQRDLMAHINHRHIVGTNNKKESTNNNQSSINSRPSVPFCTPPPSRPKAPIAPHAMAVGDPRKHSSAGHDHDFKTLPPSSHSSLPQSSYRPQSQHPVHLSAPTPVPHPQRLVSSTPQSSPMTPIDYSNPMLVTNFSSPTPTSIPNVRNNVLPMPIHETNMESRGVSMNIPMAPTFAHQSFPSQYIANPPPNAAFSVPPPMASGVNLVPQTLAQYYPNNAINYSTSLAQRSNSMQYSNSPTMMNQPRMVVNSSNNTSRRSQYLGETTGPPLPVPPPQRWHQLPSNQTHFY